MPHTCTKHEPGRPCYIAHGCRCDGCKTATTRYSRIAKHKKLRGIPSRVPSAPVLDRLRKLRETMTLADIAEASGISQNTIEALLHYKYATVSARTAAGVLGVRRPAVSPAHRTARNGCGVRRRILALAFMGWSQTAIGAEAGVDRSTVQRWSQLDKATPATFAKVDALYQRLSAKPAPKLRPTATTQTRNAAILAGGCPPLAWDEGTGPHGIDNPDATPHPWQRSTRRLTVAADVAEAAETGASLASLQTRFGLGAHGVEAALRRAGRPDLWQKVRPARLDGQETSMKEAS